MGKNFGEKAKNRDFGGGQMNTEIVAALIALLGSAIGTAGGILTSSRLTNFRLKKLEEKVDKHNTIIERTFVLEEKMKVANHRIDDLEEVTKEMEEKC